MSWLAIAGILLSAVLFRIGFDIAVEGTNEPAGAGVMVLATVIFIFSLHWGI